MEARTLNAIGEVLTILSRYPEAIHSYTSAAALFEKIKDADGEAESFNGLASLYILRGEYQLADKYSNLALRSNSKRIKAIALNNLSETYYYLSDWDEAVRLMNEASLLDESDVANQARISGRLGVIYIDKGEPEKAFGLLKRALTLWRSLNNRQEEAGTLATLGTHHAFLGEYQASLNLLNEALVISREVGDRKGEADYLAKTGYTYFCLGELDNAITHYTEGAAIYRDLKNHYREGTILGDIGDVHIVRGNSAAALENYQRSLPLVRTDKQYEAFILHGIGSSYSLQNKRTVALDSYSQALTLFRQLGNQRWEANTLTAMAAVYIALNDFERARSALDKSLKLSKEVGDLSGESLALHHLSCIDLKLNALDQAKTKIEEVIRINDSLRSNVLNQQSRVSYLASVHQYYQSYVELLMKLHAQQPAAGFDVKAFEASDRLRARSLTEMIREAQTDIRKGVDPELLARESAIQNQLNNRTQQEIVLLTSGNRNPTSLDNLQKEIQLLTRQLQQIQAQIRAASPRFAAMSQLAPVTAVDVQKMLDSDTVLIEFALGSEKSFGWAVGPTFVKSFSLPPREQVEQLARIVYEGFSTHDFDSTSRNKSHSAADTAAQQLYKLLFSDIESLIKNKRLAIVADGFLQHVPFAMLPETSSNAGVVRLIENHELITVPAASVLAVQRSQFSNRTPPPLNVAIFADPVFEKADVRSLPGGRSVLGNDARRAPVARALRSVGFDKRLGIPRLPFSRDEAASIVAAASSQQSLQALDFKASLKTIRTSDLSKYRYLHFATHGLLNSEYPELSGILLSMIDENGKQVEGFLQLHEIYNLKLAADLVVLSACQTAVGKDVKGEGLMGLTRGFMHAGAKGVIGSLWKVDDAATAELMAEFYKQMFTNKKRPATALRDAQIHISKQRRWKSPYFWAGFVLQGDWQ